MSLPSPRQFITQLLASLPPAPQALEPGTNPLTAAPDSAKKQLLTLQVLFANEFLPALDLLDRGLVVRMRVSDAAVGGNASRDAEVVGGAAASPNASDELANAIYLVRSAQHRPSRFATSVDSSTCYQVRLRAWNCSCPAFAFAAFPPELEVQTHNPHLNGKAGSFGGVTLGSGTPPVCKHLLACVLVERCEGLFGGYVVEKRVAVGEAAGWGAGWGD
jgi:hypothetical protein